MGPLIKNVRSQGEGVVQYGHSADKGVSSGADVRTFWHKKLRIFRNLWCVRMDKAGGRLSQCRHFSVKREGGQFSRFCADVLYGRPLGLIGQYNQMQNTLFYIVFLCTLDNNAYTLHYDKKTIN